MNRSATGENVLPTHIKLTLYNTLVQPDYGIMVWGFTCDRIFKLQKKAIRIVSLSKYKAHTDSIFKQLNILKAQDILQIQQYKFYYKFTHNKLPAYLQQLSLQPNHTIHNYNTRTYSDIDLNTIRHEFAKRCLRHSIPILVNRYSDLLKAYGFIHYVKVCATWSKRYARTYILLVKQESKNR